MLSDAEIERDVLLLRRLLGVEGRYCPDMIFVLDELKRHRKIERYFIVKDEQGADEAFYDSNERAIYLRQSVFQKLDHPYRASRREYRRARFTIAHEVGHMALGHKGVSFRGATSAILRTVKPK